MLPLTQSIETVAVRLATPDEQRNNKPSTFAWAYERAQAAMNSLYLKQSGGDLCRFFGAPIPRGTPFKILRTVTDLNWYVYSSPAIFEAISREYRNTHDSFFANDVAAKVLLKIGTRIFGEPLAEEDTISTCSPEKSKIYRRPFLQHLGSAAIRQRLPEINRLAGRLFSESDPDQTHMNVTQTCQRLVSAFLNRILFDLDEDESLAVAKAIVAANAYILAEATGSANDAEFEPHVRVLREAIDCALSKDTPFVRTLHADDNHFTLNQKKALIIAVYFTGLGGTISQMAGLMWHLAKNPEYQEELFQDTRAHNLEDRISPLTANMIKESFRVHPSTLTIDRPTRQPLMVTYQYGDQTQEIYIPEKTILTFYQPWAGEDCEHPGRFNPHRNDQIELYPFGRGVHQCVGQFLSEELIGRITCEFNRWFISSTRMDTLPLQGYFNLEPKEDVILEVRRRTAD